MYSFFLQGLTQPLLVPAHILALIGLGLLLGQQGIRPLRYGVMAFFIGISSGIVLTRFALPAWPWETALLAGAGLAGMLLAIRLPLLLSVCVVFAAVMGGLLGLDSTPSLIPGLKAFKIYVMMAGTVTSATFIVLLSAAIAVSLRTRWEGIVLRVLGSWVVASALMVLALLFAQH